MTQQEPQNLVGLFGSLADATATLHTLQDAGVPYANITMTAHDSAELPADLPLSQRPEQLWSVAVLVGEPLHSVALDILRAAPALLTGTQAAAHGGRDETDRGTSAWGHYVFSSEYATNQVGDAAGTAGTTGLINSGLFAENTLGEGRPDPSVIDPQTGDSRG